MSPRKRGLGRGLDALIQAAPRAQPAETLPPRGPSVHELGIDELRPNRFQPRSEFEEAGLAELADSIRAQGVIQPLVATREGGHFVIIAGERRWRAARQAGLEKVPVVVRDVSGDQELLELALVENIQRRDLNPIEEAEAYRALRDNFGLSQDQIAQRVGKARTTITNNLRLLRLPAEIQDMLRAGQLSAGQGRPLLAVTNEQGQIDLARRATQEGLTARDLERLAQGSSASGAKTPKAPPEPLEIHAAAAAEKLTKHLQTQVRIKRRGRGGVVQVRFHSEEELIRLYDLLMARGESE